MKPPRIILLLGLLLFSHVVAAANADVIAADIKAANNFDTNGFDFQIADGPVKPNTKSLGENYQCSEWFRDAKFGIYMHWGLCSVPGFNGHYARFMYDQHEPEVAQIDRKTKRSVMSGYKPGMESVYEYHVKKFGHPSQFGYKDFIPLWKADKFDADALAKLYKECGAQYIGAQAVHCDNFDLYDSTYQPWNSFRMGPHIDIVGEWKKACAKEHLHFAITSHLSNGFHEHMFYQGESDTTGPLAGVPYDTMDTNNDGLYGHRTPDRLRRLNPEFAQNWYRRSKELIDKYNPDLFYLDGPLPGGDYGLNLAAHFYNHYLGVNGKPEGVFTIKRTSPPGLTLDVESAGVGESMNQPWQVDTTINPGWFYLGPEFHDSTAGDEAAMSASKASASGPDRVRLTAGQVVQNLVDIVSKNGNMMLNVGLRADGSLPDTYRHELLDIGRWLKTNGEAIYATRPFKVFGEGSFQLPKSGTQFNDNQYHYTAEDIRFTQSKDKKSLYAILLGWPTKRTINIKSLNTDAVNFIKSVTMLATGEVLKWNQNAEGLQVTLPAKAVGEFAYVLKISDKPIPPPPTKANVHYGKLERQVLDFWKAKSAKPTPLVFFMHGGSWLTGDKSDLEYATGPVTIFLAHGISVVSINYRFIPQAEADGLKPPVKGPMDDAARALQFVRSQAGKWNIDKTRIAVAGSSAGACSTLWLTFHADLADPKSRDPVARESTKPFCAAEFVPQTSLDPQQMREWIPNSDYGARAFGIKGGFKAFLDAREKILPWITEFSPYSLVTSNSPPTGLFYRSDPSFDEIKGDPTHSANFGVKLQDHCRELGVPCEFYYPGMTNAAHTNLASYLIEQLQAPMPR